MNVISFKINFILLILLSNPLFCSDAPISVKNNSGRIIKIYSSLVGAPETIAKIYPGQEQTLYGAYDPSFSKNSVIGCLCGQTKIPVGYYGRFATDIAHFIVDEDFKAIPCQRKEYEEARSKNPKVHVHNAGKQKIVVKAKNQAGKMKTIAEVFPGQYQTVNPLPSNMVSIHMGWKKRASYDLSNNKHACFAVGSGNDSDSDY